MSGSRCAGVTSRSPHVADRVVLDVVHVTQAADRPGGQRPIAEGVEVDAGEVDGCGPVAVTVDVYSHAHGSDPGAGMDEGQAASPEAMIWSGVGDTAPPATSAETAIVVVPDGTATDVTGVVPSPTVPSEMGWSPSSCQSW